MKPPRYLTRIFRAPPGKPATRAPSAAAAFDAASNPVVAELLRDRSAAIWDMAARCAEGRQPGFLILWSPAGLAVQQVLLENHQLGPTERRDIVGDPVATLAYTALCILWDEAMRAEQAIKETVKDGR
ncbi:MAG TPA: hypothetical protein VHE78_05380 [Gemmatimonadaceae bacterium]|nr:hypothetical protein [Gemmatimonadaceae bacterium]